MKNRKTNIFTTVALFLFLVACTNSIEEKEVSTDWPEISKATKPWTRWWWMGSSVDKENITDLLVQFKEAGLGGVEIEPIYGIQGLDDKEIDFLSPEWMGLLQHTLNTADSLGMGVDLTLGTGWPYGGPNVSMHHAATKLVVDKFNVLEGARIKKEMVPENPSEKNAELKYVLAYGNSMGYKDLTDSVTNGSLIWEAKDNVAIYAIYTGKTGQKVKRAAPGGAGYTLDHYSKEALNEYLFSFKEGLDTLSLKPRTVFNDSYEVYKTDFTPHFFEEFVERRGYDLRPHFNKLIDTASSELGNRLRSDYRETLNDLLLQDFNEPWTAWTNENGMKSRLQAHGSPGNLLDLYASADIPECETFGSMPYDIEGFRRLKENIREGDADPVMLKFSSSAAHVSGKSLVSSETFTWLRDHFKTALSHCKPEVEDLFLNGVNHVFLHGSTYSPKEADWPGWKFYASVNFNPTNTIWKDAPELFKYISRCQSFLQKGRPDNDVLLYWPIYDVWNKDLPLFFQFKIHSLDEWLTDSSFYGISKQLQQKGWSSDFVSDQLLRNALVENGLIKVPGGHYKSLIVPNCKMMPLETLEKLIALKKAGGNVIFNGIPESVPGFHEFEKRSQSLKSTIDNNELELEIVSDIPNKLKDLGILPEELTTTGLKFIRRDVDGGKVYYLVNHTAESIDTYIPLNAEFTEVDIYDPLKGIIGKGKTKKDGERTSVRVQITSGSSLILKTVFDSDVEPWEYFSDSDNAISIDGPWEISFLEGGPELPTQKIIDSLQSWTLFDDVASRFSGTAQYETEFVFEGDESKAWRIDLGDVRESAKIWLNGSYLGSAWSVPYNLVAKNLQKGKNRLRVEVTNLPANRIRALELSGKEWKIFKEINMVNKDYKPFNAAEWDPVPSGLLGPITITPLEIE